MIQRRQLLAAPLAATALAAPRLAGAQGARALRFVPQSDVTVLDPLWSTAFVSRNHAFLVYDTLYGTDAGFRPQPQMAEGHVTEDEGRTWTITLRPGLRFHDGEPVRAADCVASIRRWGARDAFGQALLAATDELSALDDRRLRFRLKKPFPLLPAALGKTTVTVPFIMPERLARTDAATQVTEIVGSGPYRFVANERVAGSRTVYARFDGYVPRPEGTPSFTAGPKHVHLDRVEWVVMPDAATAAAALQAGEVDWWEQAVTDLLPTLRRNRQIETGPLETAGWIGFLRFNHLQPPFNNPAIRRAILGAIQQPDFMQAIVGNNPDLWRGNVGVFTPGTPLANDEGMGALTGPRDLDRVRRELAAAGYNGQRMVLIVPTDLPFLRAMSEVGADLFRRLGINVDYQALDWGTVLQRRTSREPVERGGWSAFFTFAGGLDFATPAGHLGLRGNGTNGWIGWPDSPELERLRDAWFDAPDLPSQQAIARRIQAQAMQDVPMIPLGQYFLATAHRRNVTDILRGAPLFWNVRKG
ncbi:MAG TPA: ABC transporter substrate-binding protein [Acetobacteraceae bacterium]|nr:ABC transporter substrate-binding protein [Acetobacteraceae bacterium]